MNLLPPAHPLRAELNDEVHARPPEALSVPSKISYLALFSSMAEREREWRGVRELAHRYGMRSLPEFATHYSADLGPFRIKYERHSEFARYKFIVAGEAGDDPFTPSAIAQVPADWVAELPGQVIHSSHVALLPAPQDLAEAGRAVDGLFDRSTPIGSAVADGAAAAFTDFRIRPDGFGRVLLQNRSMTARQAGRVVQRILEIDTYRMLALLAFPVARELAPFLSACEQELAEIAHAMVAANAKDEPILLDRLTGLAAALDRRESTNHYRFSAAAAYYELVQRRIMELRETRLPGLQTFQEFMERRLAPAMNTCRATSVRQAALSERVGRATNLLSTRVDITRQKQNHALLEAMNQRARLQLRLQQTVEGFSIAAITYYLVGLVGYGAKGLKAGHVAIDPDLIQAISIPVILLLTAAGIMSIRARVSRTDGSLAPADSPKV